MIPKIKLALLKFWKYLKFNIYGILGFTITCLIPIILLSEIAVFREDIPAQTKWTFMGAVALGTLFIIFFKKLRLFINRLDRGILRGLFNALFVGILWLLVAGLGYGLVHLIGMFKSYWFNVGFCFIIGQLFYLVHEKKMKIREKEKLDKKIQDKIDSNAEIENE